MTAYALGIGDWSTLPDWELTGAKSRSVTWRLGPAANSEASFVVDAAHRDSARIQELVTDLWFFWDRVPLYRGRVGPDSRAWSTRQTRTVSTADYRAVLGRRLLYPLNTRSWSALKPSAIAWAMVQQTQGNDGGDLGIVQGVGAGGVGAATAYQAEPSSWVAANIDTLAQMTDGFEWDVTPVSGSTALHLDIWAQRGTDRGFVLEHGSNALATGRDTDPSTYGNAGIWTGGTPSDGGTEPVPVLQQASDIATRPEGRWDVQEGNPDLVTQASLNAFSAGRIAAVQVVQPAWTFKLAKRVGLDELSTANVWQGPEQLWLGDPVLWVCKSGDLDVVETLRVVELTVTLSDSGTVELSGALGALPPSSRYRARRVDQRLTALERR